MKKAGEYVIRRNWLVLVCSAATLIAVGQPVKPFVRSMPFDSASIPREHNVDFKHLKL
ncbi:MAG: hypothetical protein IT240_07140, partial [Bacteroidia bacterium]|nr:hypothetical protein [Bacteroidia bacterium]